MFVYTLMQREFIHGNTFCFGRPECKRGLDKEISDCLEKIPKTRLFLLFRDHDDETSVLDAVRKLNEVSFNNKILVGN